ncbi:hypothetical protein QAD02_018599 [Eretmocerus hayati]|uniref:Uncharacterized protein n=1 Tax=Eretmocerus hayati TaxID=131215 RepID=A0ACC2PHH8_9HYME|nr:hypothetical protein QAD02_018599 [Eretmocerus hayati]
MGNVCNALASSVVCQRLILFLSMLYKSSALLRAAPRTAPALFRAENMQINMDPVHGEEDDFTTTKKRANKRPTLNHQTESLRRWRASHPTPNWRAQPPVKSIQPNKIYYIEFNHTKITAILPKWTPYLKYSERTGGLRLYQNPRGLR